MPSSNSPTFGEFLLEQMFPDVAMLMHCPSCHVEGEVRALTRPIRAELLLCLECGEILIVDDIVSDSGRHDLLILRKASDAEIDAKPAQAASLRETSEGIKFINGLGADEAEGQGQYAR